MVRHIIKRGQGHADQKEVHPMREWTFGICISVLVFSLLAIYSGFTFYNYYEGVESSGFQDVSVVLYEQKRVEAVLTQYEERQRTFVNLRGDRSHAAVNPPVTIGEITDAELADE